MKKIRLIMVIVLTIVVVMQIPIIALATPENNMAETKSEMSLEDFSFPYEMPIMPYMEEWNNLSSDEKVLTMNIPFYDLKMLSTEDLFLTSLQFYQIEQQVNIRNSFYDAHEILDEYCNVYHELINRADVFDVLDQLQENGCPYPTDYESGRFFLDRENYLKSSFDNWDSYIIYFSLGAEIAVLEKEYFFRGDEFNPDKLGLGTSFLTDIGKRWADGSIAMYANIYTPKGTKVEEAYLDRHPDYTDKEKQDIYNQFIDDHDVGFTIYQLPTKKYNCHSYAWYWSATGNNIWMDSPREYISDGSYVVCSASEPIKVGYIAYYRKHSGIVSQVDSNGQIWVTSKWGSDCLAKHPANTGLFNYGAPIAYYKPAG